MKYLIQVLIAVAACPSGWAQSDDAISTVSKSAQEKLATSVEELNRLREQIAAEKVPLSEELTQLEEQLVVARKKHTDLVREADTLNLEVTTAKTKVTSKEGEFTYLSGILDEYAKTFESRVHISEMQALGPAVESAKQVTENKTLTVAEKFARQTNFVDLTIRRLFDVIGGTWFSGVAVDLQGAVVSGRFALLGPIALFRGVDAGATGLVVPQTGSTNPLVRPLEGPAQAGIAALVDNGEGLLPVDPSRGGALKALVQKTNLLHIFEKGGPIMWPLLLASILALGAVLERVWFLSRERMNQDLKGRDQFFTAVTHGDISGALQIGKSSKDFVLRVMAYALGHREQSIANALLYAQSLELKRFRRGVSILDTVITLAPLLGLLGTVTGMMGSFSLIGGDLSAPGAITGGIAEALIATAFGLGIAIVSLLPFNWLNTRIDEVGSEMEAASARLELLVRPTEVESKHKTFVPTHAPVKVHEFANA